VSEWLKEHAWKACVGETLPWVRIPPSPPYCSEVTNGEVPEWLNGTVSKTVDRATGPWVRIPPSPPFLPDRVRSSGLAVLDGRGKGGVSYRFRSGLKSPYLSTPAITSSSHVKEGGTQ
jgi:hypothetical protein